MIYSLQFHYPFQVIAMTVLLLDSVIGNSEDKTFNIAGVSLAGHPNSSRIKHGECVRVFTGAKVPDECDQIILQEEVEFADESIVRFQDHQPGETYVRPVGHDIDRNQQIAMKGQELNPISLSRLSDSGVNKVNVFRKPKIGVLSSGDELVSKIPYSELNDGQIFESNKTFAQISRKAQRRNRGPWRWGFSKERASSKYCREVMI